MKPITKLIFSIALLVAAIHKGHAIAPDKPIVNQVQTFCYDPAIPVFVSDLTIISVLNGNTLRWYAAESDVTPLPLETPLVDQQKYYAALVNVLGEESNRTETKVNLLNPIFNAPNATCYGDNVAISITNIPSTPQDFIQRFPELTLFLEDPVNKTAYFLKEESMSWTQAYNYIQSFGESAAMYVINSKAEENMVYNALSAVQINGQPITGTPDYHFWLGLRQVAGEKPNNAVDKDWFWLDGRPLTPDLANWTAGEPNDYGSSSTYVEMGNEDYGQFDFDAVKTWNDMRDVSAGGNSWPVFEFNGSTSVRWGSYDSNGDEIFYDETSSILNLELLESTTFFVEVETNGIYCRREHTIVVNAIPTVNPLPDLEFCDNNADGDDTNGRVQNIDLTIQNAIALGVGRSETNFKIQYFHTESDANADFNEIIGGYEFVPEPGYIPGTQTSKDLFLRLTDLDTGCFSIASFAIVLNPLPVAYPVSTQYLCDDAISGSDSDGIVNTWDFSNLYFEVLQGQDPGSHTVSYHLNSESAADLADTGITFPFTNTSVNTQEIFIRVQNTNTLCYSAKTSFTISVSPLPVLKNNLIIHEQCDDDDTNDGITLFNLHSWESEFSDNSTLETFEFYKDPGLTSGSLIANPTQYYNEAFEETIYVKILSAAGCFRTGQLTLKVAASLIRNDFMLEYLACDDTDPFNQLGTAVFPAIVLDEIKTKLIQTDTKFSLQAVSIDFYYSQEEALTTTNSLKMGLPFQTRDPWKQEIWALVTNKNVNTITCLGLKQVAVLWVDPVAIPYPIQIDRQCDGDSADDLDATDGIFPFDTSSVNNQALQSQSGVTTLFYDEAGNFIGNTFPNRFDSPTQIISVYLEKESLRPDLIRQNPEACTTSTTFELRVDKMPFLPLPIELRQCDNGISDTDGIAIFQTDTLHEALLSGQSDMDILYTDAFGTPLFTEFPDTFQTFSTTIQVRLKNPKNGNCLATTEISFRVDKLPEFETEESIYLCKNLGVINIGVVHDDGREYTYKWDYTDVNGTSVTLGNTDSRLDATASGFYHLTLTNKGVDGCFRTKTIEVIDSNIASLTNNDLSINDLKYGNTNSIQIDTTTLGIGNYEFRLGDSGSYSDVPEFNDVPPGIHTLYVNDKNGCGTVYINLSIIGYYRFFTPNSDGYNDYWNVFGISAVFQPKSELYIFDRFGKLITQIDPRSKGWDGTLNGRPLPDTDYWFHLQLEDGRTAKGHFSLIRGY
ncbi:MAG: hypothetical protein RLZZ241_111 [Bacteroidota bacterium]